jgi:hypothetical protein
MLEQCALLRYPGFDLGITMGYCQTSCADFVAGHFTREGCHHAWTTQRGAPASAHSVDHRDIFHPARAFERAGKELKDGAVCKGTVARQREG